VRHPPDWLARCRSEQLEQGYLAIEGDDVEVRVRRRGRAEYLTVKQGIGLTRTEAEIELTDEQFAALWPLSVARRISKRRHYVTAGGADIEVDVYSGGLTGLVIAEAEFADEEAAKSFEPLDWFDEEVTGEPGYANKNLATRGLPERKG
jgi:adenylate cyclase